MYKVIICSGSVEERVVGRNAGKLNINCIHIYCIYGLLSIVYQWLFVVCIKLLDYFVLTWPINHREKNKWKQTMIFKKKHQFLNKKTFVLRYDGLEGI